MVHELDDITLSVQDLEACLIAYRDVLGLAVLEASPRFVLLPAGNCRLGLHAAEQPLQGGGINLAG